MLATNKCAAFGALLTKLSLAILAIAAFAFTSRSLADPGFLYVTDLADGSIKVYAPDGTPSTFATGLISPQGICFDQYKNLYVADAGDGGAGNGVIYKYDVITQDRITVISGLSNPIGITQDGGEWSPQLMAHVGDKLGFVLAGDLELPALLGDLVEEACILKRDG